MKKLLLTGSLVFLCLPFLVHAEWTDGTLTQAQIDYIAKQNCDTFTGDTKNFCIEKKLQARKQLEQNGASSQTTPVNPQTATPPTQPMNTNIPPTNPPTNTPPPQDNQNTVLTSDQINYIMKLNCDTFTGDNKNLCISKKMQAHKQLEQNGWGTQNPSLNTPPATQETKRDMQPPVGDNSGGIRPPREVGEPPRPPRDGTGTHDVRDQNPPSDQNPPHDSIGQAVQKLSPADREELMKLIRSFLESKGIQITLPPVRQDGNTTVNLPLKDQNQITPVPAQKDGQAPQQKNGMEHNTKKNPPKRDLQKKRPEVQNSTQK